MGKDTAIAWTDHTYNPWWGCMKVAPECGGCYAEGFAKRTGHAVWGAIAPRRFFGDKHWSEPLKWNRDAEKAGVRRRVFCGSMCDVFEDRADLREPRRKLWALISMTPHLDWLLLTKRPENIAALLPGTWGTGWPNVWLGTSAGTQETWDRAVPRLLRVPARVRFVSAEPLLGPVDPTHALPREPGCLDPDAFGDQSGLPGVDWVIVGGESGPRARPMRVEWVRHIKEQCDAAGVAFFAKQLGGHPNKRDALEDFPADLRIRAFPAPPES